MFLCKVCIYQLGTEGKVGILTSLHKLQKRDMVHLQFLDAICEQMDVVFEDARFPRRKDSSVSGELGGKDEKRKEKHTEKPYASPHSPTPAPKPQQYHSHPLY